MQSNTFQYTRLQDGQKLHPETLGKWLGFSDPSKETWLFVAPHDDDLCLGAGLLMLAAVEAGVDVHVVVTTDGNMGYCTLEQKDNIAEIRASETYESFEILGIGKDKVHYINYPDGGLSLYQGRRAAKPGEEAMAVEGYVGLQNAFTHQLRTIRPTRVFVPTQTDLHPDHRITHSELMISLFHASGAIWPELGEPLETVPEVYELAVYCDFLESPTLQIQGNDAVFETKLKSIAAFRSQVQIEQLVKSIRKAGAFEYIREVSFRFYSPENYKHLFS